MGDQMATSLTEKLTAELRERILYGVIAPGTMVVEPRLAEEFKVSKTPVRESLRQLTSEGLLQILPKKGYLVRGVTLNDVYETLDMRMLLEPFTAAGAARHATAPFIAALRSQLDEQSRLAAEDPIGSMRCAQQFHRQLAEGGRNSRIAAALERCFHDTARAHYVLPGMQAYMSTSREIQEHEAIVQAIEAGEAKAAQQAMAEHLKSIRNAMLNQFETDDIWE